MKPICGSTRGNAQRNCLVVADLSRPNTRILPLLLLADTLRAQGASSIGLIAPYLPYMRQDRAFRRGESVSSRHFAELISSHFDTLLTVDAHLHRYRSLAELYRIPATNLSASALLGAWIAEHIDAPVLFGPDAESRQWVSDTAKTLGCPWRVLEKSRQGDRSVEVHGTIDASLHGRTPVLIDDMISTGTTLIEGSRLLQKARFGKARVLAVHGIFAGDSEARLRAAGPAKSSPAIPSPTRAMRSGSRRCWRNICAQAHHWRARPIPESAKRQFAPASCPQFAAPFSVAACCCPSGIHRSRARPDDPRGSPTPPATGHDAYHRPRTPCRHRSGRHPRLQYRPGHSSAGPC